MQLLTLRILRDLADGPSIAWPLQKKYERLKLARGNASVYNALSNLCRLGYAKKSKIDGHNYYFITPSGIQLLEEFQFSRSA